MRSTVRCESVVIGSNPCWLSGFSLWNPVADDVAAQRPHARGVPFAILSLSPVVNIITTSKQTPSYARLVILKQVCTIGQQQRAESEHPLPHVSLFNRDTYSVKTDIHTDMFPRDTLRQVVLTDTVHLAGVTIGACMTSKLLCEGSVFGCFQSQPSKKPRFSFKLWKLTVTARIPFLRKRSCA